MQIASTPSTTATATTTQPGSQQADLEKAAKAFEAIFMRQMLGAMRSASLDEGLGDSSATMQFRDMADAKTADNMAETGKFGIAELLMKQFAGKIAPSPLATATPATGEAAK